MKQTDPSSCFPTFHFNTKNVLLCLLVSASLLYSVLTSPFGGAASNGRGCDWCITVYICQTVLLTFILCSSLLHELKFHKEVLAAASVTSRLQFLWSVTALA